MSIYRIKYRLAGSAKWETLKSVVGDSIEYLTTVNKDKTTYLSYIIYLADNSVVRLPIDTAMQFSKERHALIHKQMESDAGQKIPVKQGE